MRKCHRAGDSVLVLEGPEKGQTLTVSSVRMFATDNGYYLRGGSGLYSPKTVKLVAERPEGNPCSTACDQGKHDALGTCDHCRGTCACASNRAVTRTHAIEK
ncbi:hypothetical protein [Streptomyces lasalocidi]|uniref:Uncharacterized protein n=1 Tax=Streptomyces lasalocidi TaxID=324833 RepID=A0A4U5W4I3_STRLS|nr:hypothetical protein [Streptomyces lasalocidi]TKS96317.1 hypothetical protein E4U91_37210 [Streptomyces lasalocidi]